MGMGKEIEMETGMGMEMVMEMEWIMNENNIPKYGIRKHFFVKNHNNNFSAKEI